MARPLRHRAAALFMAALLAATLLGAGLLPVSAFAAASPYASARQQWFHAACADAALQGSIWRRAADDLRHSHPLTAADRLTIGRLDGLAALPETSETSAQMGRAVADVTGIDRFFHTRLLLKGGGPTRC
jgi:hypothetical protein